MIYRPYQAEMDNNIVASWNAGSKNVLAVLPTGGGKTVLFTGILSREKGISCSIAHRKELVGQMSLALNKRGVQHFAIAPEATIKWIVSQHIQEHGKSFYNPSARCAVAGVDTIGSRQKQLADWCQRVSLWVMDEGHHVIRKNKWGKAIEMFPNARGLLVTATPERADGKGLGRHADGVVDDMIIGPTARDLINAGYLTDYRIFAPPNQLHLTEADVSAATGDYKHNRMVQEVRESKIIGNVVDHYIKHAAGKIGVTFVPDVLTASEMAQSFRSAGVPAEVVSATTPNDVRAESVRRLRRGDYKQLVNVDIFGEGFDLPGIEVISFARPTESYVLYCQQFGRSLRIMDGKMYALIIDHVGNVLRHGLPDAPRVWSLDAREKRTSSRSGIIALRACNQCTGVYEAFYKSCPYCGWQHVPAVRSAPEFVDGDLLELDAAVLAQMRQEVAKIDESAEEIKCRMLRAGAPPIAAAGAAKQHRLRQEAQADLRQAMMLYGGMQQAQGRDNQEGWRRFYHQFKIDVLSAQALGRPDAERLTQEIRRVLS